MIRIRSRDGLGEGANRQPASHRGPTPAPKPCLDAFPKSKFAVSGENHLHAGDGSRSFGASKVHKRVPKTSCSSPVHSPPRPLTVRNQQDWKIPPCVSNWKNPKGYTIPRDKRLVAADGRGLKEIKINNNFAELSEALYVVEESAREAVAMQFKVQNEIMMKEKDKKEMELQELARKSRSERSTGGISDGDMIIDKRNGCGGKEFEMTDGKKGRGERRMEGKDAAVGKKRTIKRDGDHDITEEVALGMASNGGRGVEVMYDERSFNQEKGMDSGFAIDDAYNIYDNGIFAAQSTMSCLCRPMKT